MFEFIEESFDEITVSVEERAESRDVLTVRHWLDAGPCAACGQSGAHGVAVIGTVSKQDAAFAKTIEHVIGGSTVMRLPFGQLESNRQAERTDQSKIGRASWRDRGCQYV